ncbi:MAG TPA: tripartite tricarboxylate transporter substrate binding protein [Pseudolabrys sp.]
MKPILPRLALAFCLSAQLAANTQASAQSWPSRSISLLTTFAGGGSGDIVARTFAEFASKELGQPVIVENRPGGGGVVAAAAVAKAAPDGYTLSIQAVGPMSLRPLFEPPVGYDPVADFTPIGLLAETPNVIASSAKFPPRTIAEMVDWAKKNPKGLTMGHPGPGTIGHLGLLLLASKTGFSGAYISYRSSGPMIPDLLSGEIDIACAAYNPLFLSEGRVLAVMTPDPVEFLPGVPSMREAGFPGIYASTWYGIVGPANLPPEVVTKVNAVMNAFLRRDDTKKRFTAVGVQPRGGTPEQFAQKMADDKLVWSKVVKDANIKMTE